MKLFTVGYGGRNRDEFLNLIRANGIQTIVDIRLRPDRASMGIWVKAKTPDKGIESWLKPAGIRYHSLIELGNVFLDFPDWKTRYRQMLDSAGELLTERLKRLLAEEGPMGLLCAEKKVEDCHRLLVADYLAIHMQGLDILHLE